MAGELVDILMRYTAAQDGPGPFATAIEGVTVLRSDRERQPNHIIVKPALCIVVQGAKWTAFGAQRFDYRAGQALVVTVEMPAMGSIVEARPDAPYLGLVIELDPGTMRDVLAQLPPLPAQQGTGRGVFLTPFEGPLADCALRLARLLDMPGALPALAPMIQREIHYWLLAGPDGGDIARITLGTSHAPRIIGAIHRLRQRFAEPFRVEELAAVAHLSPSAFHRQFKALTAMSPVQYQKQLRLLEARRLMVSGAANAETAAHRVGYESASQFSREYARMFGAAPRRDAQALRAALA